MLSRSLYRLFSLLSIIGILMSYSPVQTLCASCTLQNACIIYKKKNIILSFVYNKFGQIHSLLLDTKSCLMLKLVSC